MSKKIIYLLSLLMALSLVFASCKKNGAGDISGPGPTDNGTDNSPTTEDGLAPNQDWLDKNSEAPIKNDKIDGLQSVGNQAYYRNPVIVVLGSKGNHVAVFTEKRYKSLGADNDIALDGNTAADIVSAISVDSGKSWKGVSLVGRNSPVTLPKDAVAAPVVFKTSNTEVVVVASSGVGLSRVNQNYTARGNTSGLMYTVGTYNESAGSFQWSAWADMTQTITEAINKASSSFSGDGKQFAVHSGRGIVDANGNMYFAVTVSDQGKNGGTNPKELMGNIIIKGTKPASSKVTWAAIDGSAVKFDNIDTAGRFSTHKESRVIGVKTADTTTAGDIEYIAVGNPYYNNNAGNNFIGYAVAGQQPKDNGIPGSEGSPAYLNVEKWYGQTGYDPTQYLTQPQSTSQRLFAHVKSRNNIITMYALSGATGFSSTGKPYTVIGFPDDGTALAKSSSMDVLGDGTIIMATEQGGSERVYNVVYKRFTQKFLATKLGI